ncbi:protein-arginine deiminase domain-containing protein [Streptomyces griseiscabiei]|uniref:Protein-arginine deiminase domain-containing protein n=1 Tax=Streptomyces griseiscabiei TaxID=2993540 RepID=A0ABU4L0M9_9ACTN|nr:protein-arginine deiminase domain-containing protein [Streptomyces griseiscabiei]MDX2909212.1 protein-arginine deiminase domain-containing protein [Streptomyces griseiscabiei]
MPPRPARPTHRAIAVLAVSGTLLVTPSLAAPTAFAAGAPATDLRVDTNRDGKVDVTGTTDTAGENGWTLARGALMLPNIDDDTRRCPTKGANGKPLTDAKLAACNDASDTKVNGTADAADLARVRSVPRSVPAGAQGTVKVTAGAQQVRVFVKRGTKWEPVTAKTRLSRAELKAGVEFGVEAKDVIRDTAKWDGTARVRLTVKSSKGTTADSVTLRVAPLLTHHHLQNAQQLLVTKVTGGNYGKLNRAFREGLDKAAKNAGITQPTVNFTKYGDIWAQDFVEPAYVSMTGANGKRQAMRVMLRSAQLDREAGRELFEKMRGPNIGAVQVTGAKDSEEWTLNSMGNLETIPPYAHGERSFPAGRIIMGQRPDVGSKPAKVMRTFLKSQGLQDPLFLDTSWLHVGHVDEFVQFLPADTPRGWKIAIADPEAGLKLLRDAKAAGHGAKPMFSLPNVPWESISEALGSKNLVSDNNLATRRIEANLAVLKRETGVTDAEIVRVPALYTQGREMVGETASGKDAKTRLPRLTRLGAGTELPEVAREYGQQRRLDEPGEGLGTPSPMAPAPAPSVMTSAYVPGAVNGVVLSRTHYLAPRQWGPVINGKDIFTEAVTAAYSGAGMKVSYLDDWETYHLGMGEIHCGTNTLRNTSAAWWTR